MAEASLEVLLARNARLGEAFRSIAQKRLDALAKVDPSRTVRASDLPQLLDAVFDQSRRRIVGIAGFPGSGKTTLALSVVAHLNAAHRRNVAAHLPLDGFHRRNEELVRLGLDSKKGDLSTYDVEGFSNALHRFVSSDSEEQFAPTYDRSVHEVVENAIRIEPDVRLLVTEGIYVGCTDGAWQAPSGLLDRLFFLDVEPQTSLQRVVTRNAAAGRSEDIISMKLQRDLDFMDRVIAIVPRADFVVRDDALHSS